VGCCLPEEDRASSVSWTQILEKEKEGERAIRESVGETVKDRRKDKDREIAMQRDSEGVSE
jgi:hypothetical protein